MNPVLPWILLLSTLQSPLRVELQERAGVRGTSIRLGEIASIHCEDETLARRLSTYDLGYAPAPGYSRYLRRDQITNDLARAFPALELEVGGGEGCRIEPLVEEVSAESVEECARAALAELFASQEVELSLQGQLLPLQVPLGQKPCELRALARDQRLDAGMRTMPVEVLVDGEPYQTLWTSWKVELWRDMPVLARPLRRGETLQPAAFEMRRVKLESKEPEAPLAIESASGGIARRDIPAGTTLTLRDLEFPVVIARGDLVRLDVQRGSIRASTLVLAQQDGRLGDRIRVQQPETGKELVALVRSKVLVEIRWNQ